MKIKNLYIKYFADYENRRVHVLEEGRPVYHDNLPSNIGEEFQKELIEQSDLLIDTLNFEWVCYCQNGLVLSFKEKRLGLISKTDESLYMPFRGALK